MGERQKPGAVLKTKSDELVLEKFFLDYITVWFRERIVTPVQYDRARKEIELLKDKKKTKEKKKNSKSGEDIAAGKDFTCNCQREVLDSGRSRSGTSKGVSATQERRPETLASDKNRNDGTQHRQELQSLRQQNENLEQKIYSLKEKISVLRANAHYELTEKDGQIEKLKKLLETSRLQNDDLSKRLSKLAGDKLHQGNPDLADLSDRYRPTEVGKMFSEVYDNEWSDAFETEETDEEIAAVKNIRSDGDVPGRCTFRTHESIVEMRSDETQHRSSKLAGDKLRHGNPDQVNLSDRYKPKGVGEMFSEVYDKEWAHAFKNIPKMDEDKKVGILHGIIMNAFSFCKERIEEQDREIKNILIKSNERQQDGRIHKQITESLGKLRIQLVNEMAEEIAQDFESRSLQGLLIVLGLKLDGINTAVRRYALKCVQICWLSLVCIPDVSVSQGEVGAPFDPETYESFSGRLSRFRQPAIALCVWPVLFQGSNILVKGVAKPMETK